MRSRILPAVLVGISGPLVAMVLFAVFFVVYLVGGITQNEIALWGWRHADLGGVLLDVLPVLATVGTYLLTRPIRAGYGAAAIVGIALLVWFFEPPLAFILAVCSAGIRLATPTRPRADQGPSAPMDRPA
jgi:hypothetical protein